MWGYDGAFPGPTVETRRGRRTVVRHRNELPVPTVVHLHGGVTPPEHDGHATDVVAPVGGHRPGHGGHGGHSMLNVVGEGSFDYDYPNDQRAATLWYHDHRLDFTGPQVWRGLAGFHIVRDEEEDALPLPKGEKDVPLMICDRSFGEDGSFLYPSTDPSLMGEPGVTDAYMQGVLGDVILVNGAPWPQMEVSNTRHRFRILNASNARRSFRLRPAVATDAPFLSGLHRQARGRYLLTSSRDEEMWRYEVSGRDPESEEALEVRIVEDAAGEPAGYVCHARDLREGDLRVKGYELADGVSWLEANPAVLRGLAEIGHERTSHGEGLASLTFVLGEHHPLYEAIPEPPLYRLDRRNHYSFYVRVPNLPAFLSHVAPALERRLAHSVAAGHTGELRVSFYDGGLRLGLERGRLSGVEDWEPTDEEAGDAAFPGLSFLQLLFGHLTLEELDHALADCSPGEGDARVLLKALFPRRPSDLWPV